jgi:hypothetical protein
LTATSFPTRSLLLLATVVGVLLEVVPMLVFLVVLLPLTTVISV